MAYGARLESVLGASPRGFESPILRHQSGTVRFRIFFMPYLLPLFPALATPRLLPAPGPPLTPPLTPPSPAAPGPLSPGPGFTPGPAFSRRRRPAPSLPLPIANTLRNSPAATFKAEPSSVAYLLTAD